MKKIYLTQILQVMIHIGTFLELSAFRKQNDYEIKSDSDSLSTLKKTGSFSDENNLCLGSTLNDSACASSENFTTRRKKRNRKKCKCSCNECVKPRKCCKRKCRSCFIPPPNIFFPIYPVPVIEWSGPLTTTCNSSTLEPTTPKPEITTTTKATTTKTATTEAKTLSTIPPVNIRCPDVSCIPKSWLRGKTSYRGSLKTILPTQKKKIIKIIPKRVVEIPEAFADSFLAQVQKLNEIPEDERSIDVQEVKFASIVIPNEETTVKDDKLLDNINNKINFIKVKNKIKLYQSEESKAYVDNEEMENPKETTIRDEKFVDKINYKRNVKKMKIKPKLYLSEENSEYMENYYDNALHFRREKYLATERNFKMHLGRKRLYSPRKHATTNKKNRIVNKRLTSNRNIRTFRTRPI